ncbi:MAG TPA: pyridoxal phosphate-dependent aminotransferase [Syntrophales bacterium]|jgi:aspartate aminotransferase|nr:pyridoxal phosphate-dependent aminotransferase [Syntrophales bacterium]HON23811.1 pyridoxal phosphate-dependent aminotransferase [Syntrophales bacterium]HOU77134.1 pyridoxal phosphate-dependent aminotransferase [Syntrophales bacterium]HPC33712.1 pyridoxal phosphate-dependent aminotransferase [Syntrophales bacterium]HQG33662.1 pyridoxal phosphate-dependent aminotransferase [Syntrophales bacterium]
MAIAGKIQGFITQSSWIRKMFEEGIQLKQEFGAGNVYDFSLGNPNVEPPEKLRQVLRDVAGEDIPGKHAYMPNAGYPETRRVVADYLSREHDLKITGDQVVMTVGAGGALNVIMKTILDPGDEVVIPTPYFVEYRFYVDNGGGVTVPVPTRGDFSLDLRAIEAGINARTKAVLINSPNNPTGRVYDDASLRGLAEILISKSRQSGRVIYLISDEPYRDIVYDGIQVPSVLKSYHNSIVAYSYSKSLSLSGERIGYLAVHPECDAAADLMAGLVLCNRMLGFVNAPALMQRVIARVQGLNVDAGIYRRKRDLLCDGLASVGYEVRKPEGAFYLFQKAPIADDVAFVRALQEERILTVPGSGFGGPGYIRIAYCVDDATITNAIGGFGRVLNKFR